MPAKTNVLKTGKFKITTEMSVLIAYIMLIIVFAILSPYFLTVKNIMNIGQFTAINGIAATAMTLVLISGGLDVSIGSIGALASVVMATCIPTTGSGWEVILLCLGVGLLCGFINAVLITWVNVNPLIVTLGTMSIFRGIAYLVTDGRSVALKNTSLSFLGRGFIFDVIPVSLVIMVICIAVFSFILRKTTFGRKVYSIGGNENASYLAGIGINKVKMVIYMLCGLMASLSGIITTCQTSSGAPSAMSETNLDVIAAVILGGTNLAGGQGKMWGTVIGVLFLSTVSNGLAILGLSTFWQLIVKGLVLVLAVTIDAIRKKEKQ